MRPVLIIFTGWKRGAPRITLARMVANVLLETGIGMIPIVGDVAHIAWKSNRRNFNLLVRERERPQQHKRRDWVFILVLIIGALTVCCLRTVGAFRVLGGLFWRTSVTKRRVSQEARRECSQPDNRASPIVNLGVGSASHCRPRNIGGESMVLIHDSFLRRYQSDQLDLLTNSRMRRWRHREQLS
jgi:hypothetical protein